MTTLRRSHTDYEALARQFEQHASEVERERAAADEESTSLAATNAALQKELDAQVRLGKKEKNTCLTNQTY